MSLKQKPKPVDILKALADDHILRIFEMTSNGMSSSIENPGKIGLTRKQYYSRLQRLVKLGLIEKLEGKYRHTTLGTLVANTQIKPLEEALSNYWSLMAVDELKKSPVMPREEQDKIIETIMSVTGLKHDLIGSHPSVFKIMRTFDDLVRELVLEVKSASKEIYLASRYYDPSVSQAIVERFAAGVKVNILDGNPTGTSLMARIQSVLRASTDPSMAALALALAKSPNSRIRSTRLYLSFVVVDRERCGIEIPHPINPQEFNMAIGIQDREFSSLLIGHFEELWKKAEEPKIETEIMTH